VTTEQDFETVRNTLLLPHAMMPRNFDTAQAALSRIEAEYHMHHGGDTSVVHVSRESQDALYRQRDALKAENAFHKKALEEWNCKAEERLDTINALKAANERNLKRARYEWSKVANERDVLRAALEKAKELLAAAAFGSWAPEEQRPEFRVAYDLARQALEEVEK